MGHCEGSAPLYRYRYNQQESLMRSTLILFTFLSLLLAKEINYPVQPKPTNQSQLLSTSGQEGILSRSSREDTTTIFFEDFEGDVAGWTADPEWVLTEDQSNSATHSFHIDDDNFDVISDLISPLISLPDLDEYSAISFNFALNCNLVDSDGDGDNFLEDYYWVDIANVTDVPVYFHEDSTDAYDGQSWWCADPAIGGYSDAWVQFLQSPTVTIPTMDPSMSVMMKWGIEDYAGASVAGTCTDGWDAANVRISSDGGETWQLLEGDDPYDFNYGYGWLYNDEEYDCGGTLEDVAAGWGGQADWHEVTFDLSAYAGQDVIINFAFGSDPAYSTGDDGSLIGFMVDNIVVTAGNGDVAFVDNADDENHMIPMNGLTFAWEQIFYDYGDITRPGGLGWDTYDAGEPFNGNIPLDLTNYAGADVLFRWRVRLDDNHDGGNGEGFFLDDFHVWEVDYNVVPTVQNLNIESADHQVTVTWDMPPSELYDNDEIAHDDGSPENSWAWGLETIKYGAVFDMPYGTESVVVHTASFAPNSLNDEPIEAEIEAYNVSVNGIPESEPIYTLSATLVSQDWTDVDLPDWVFVGDFLISMAVDSNVYMNIDENATTGYSYISSPEFNSDDWFGINDILDVPGEWLIRATVTTTGTATEPQFNVYRDPGLDGSEWQLMFNGQNISTNFYVDNLAENGSEYCYKVSAIYGTEESDFAGPVCAIPEAETVYQIAYDDGSAETSFNVGALNFLAVKFTPSAYPVDLYRASIFTVGTSNGVGLLHVWDDDGENGLPGTILLNAFPLSMIGDTWQQLLLNDFDIEITEGSFYVGIMGTDQTPPIGIDTDNNAANSILDYENSGWLPFGDFFDGAMMIRVDVDSVNVLGLNDNLSGTLPGTFGLKQNYPNPFNPTTTIEFDLASSAFTSLALYDITGREVKSLVQRNLSAGHYVFGLNASELPSGMYFYKLTAHEDDGQKLFSSTKKLVLMK